MERDPTKVEVLAARVEKAIHQSHELIRQSKMLEVWTAVFLNQLKNEREFTPYPMAQAQPFGNILSPLKWVLKAALQITGRPWGISNWLIQLRAACASRHNTDSVSRFLTSSAVCMQTKQRAVQRSGVAEESSSTT